MLRPLQILAVLVASSAAPVVSAGDDAKSLELFEKHVRPTLVEHCIRCHGAKKQQGGLRLDSRDAMLEGGDSGEAVVPGEPDDSLLIGAIRYSDAGFEMPPRGKLSDKTIAAFEQWVKLGASDPRVANPTKSGDESAPQPDSPSVEEGRSFWAFQAVNKPNVPQEVSWGKTEIDRFVAHRAAASGLSPVGGADRETLIRRAYFDLIGLPPTPEQTRAFVQDDSVDAYEQLVDELLDSPHFGERWGRHWLDVVRYAESSGGGRTLLFPNAWRYRDYVIESFNRDLPFNEFIKQQIAGDLMEFTDWQDRRRKMIATAFLLLGPSNFELQDKDILEMDIVDEQLDTIGKSMMGMTIGCARCHDHKFDPIPTSDYYALAGILTSTKAVIHSNVSTWNKANLPLPPEKQATLDAHRKRLKRLEQAMDLATVAWKKAGGKPKKSKEHRVAKSIPWASLPGIVIDDSDAEKIGMWVESTSIQGFVGENYIHDATDGKGMKRVVYKTKLPTTEKYEVRISHTVSGNRATKVPVTVSFADGEKTVFVNQRKPGSIDRTFNSLGVFEFDKDAEATVTISNRGTLDGVVIADSVLFIPSNPVKAKKEKTAPPINSPESPESSDAKKQRELKLMQLEMRVDELAAELNAEKAKAPSVETAMVTADEDKPGDIHVAIRGVVHNNGPMVPRGFLQVASPPGIASAIDETSSGRLQLADWIASAEHPLTSRVMANRVWYWLIGEGLVSSVDNFGATGQKPSHPELLDYLASSFSQNGWSVKRLVRQIMLSKTYRLATIHNDANASIDPGNKLLWRMNRKRLRAEDVRDSLLFVSGNLDLQTGGRTIKEGTSIEYGYQFDGRYRSVYVPVFRNTLPELFEVFDFADPNIQQGKRSESTIASQALWLMNNPFVHEQCEDAAKKLVEQEPVSGDWCVQQIYLQVLGRTPSSEEAELALKFIDFDNAKLRQSHLAMLYQTLFQCVDFRYLN